MQQVAVEPASTSSRQSLISLAQVLTARFNSVNSRLSEINDGVNAGLVSAVTSINAYAKQIADLNQQIFVAQATANGQPPNDLLDQRDQQVIELNKLVGVRTLMSDSGSLNVFMGSGQQLVIGSSANTMTATPSAADPTRVAVGLQVLSTSVELPENLVSGGSLGGLLAFRRDSLEPTANQLGRVALDLVQTFNAQHALGQDLSGNKAGDANFEPDFFVVSPNAPTIFSNTSNTGTASLTATFDAPSANATNFYSNLNVSDYRLAYDGTNYTVTRLSDQTVFSSATLPFALPTEGFSIQLGSGVISTNDSFIIKPTHDAPGRLTLNSSIAADPRLIAAASPVRAQVTGTNSGTASIVAPTVATGYTAPVAGTPARFTFAAGNLAVSGLANGTVLTVTSAGVSTNYTVAAGTASFVYSSGDTIAFNGLTTQINGTPGAGDSFTVEANSSGVSDGTNSVLLGKLLTQKTMLGGTASYQTAYSQLVSDIGNKTREIQLKQKAQQSLLDQSVAAREAQSGVNLDEEAANLLRYQQAFQASAKLIEYGGKILDTILAI